MKPDPSTPQITGSQTRSDIDAAWTTRGMAMGSARQSNIDMLLEQAERAGLELRRLPDEPLTCCGRGCNGCVWEGYFTAVDDWCEDAETALETLSKK